MTRSDNGLAAALRRAREALHLSQAELAARAGVSMQTVSRVERGMPVAGDTVRAVAAAMGIDAAALPPRPVRDAMPGLGVTDPHWRDFVSTLAEAGEKVVAWEDANRERYVAMAAPARPTARTLLPGDWEPSTWFCMALAMSQAVPLTLGLMHQDSFGHRPELAIEVAVYMACCALSGIAFLVGIGTWRKHAPVRAHDMAVATMAEALGHERHVITDRAAYVAMGGGGRAYSWKRMALPVPFVRSVPVDGIAPDVCAVVLEDAAGDTLTFRSPQAGGAVTRALAVDGARARAA